MSFAITNKTTTYSQPTATVRSEEEEKHHGKAYSAQASGGRVLTAPQPRKHFIARSGDAASITAEQAHIAINSLKDYGEKLKEKSNLTFYFEQNKIMSEASKDDNAKLKALKDLLKNHIDCAKEQTTGTDSGKPHNATSIDAITILNDLKAIVKDATLSIPGDQAAFDSRIQALDKELVPLKEKAEPFLERLKPRMTEAQFNEKAKGFIKERFGSGLWGTAAIAAVIGGIAAGISYFMGNNKAQAAEAKAQAAEDKVTALEQQLQELLRGLVTQVIQPMQVKGDKAIDLLARLLKLEQKKAMGTASAPVRSSVSSAKVASRSAHSDDNSATPPAVDLAKLEKEVAELEKQQASGGGKPAPAQPQGGGTPHAGAIPQPVTMPQQNGQATESPMPQQPETQRIRFHRFPEDARNGAVPTNAFLGDKVITRKVSNTGDRAIIEKDDDC